MALRKRIAPPRKVGAVLVGHDRVTVRPPGEERLRVLPARGSQFEAGELRDVVRDCQELLGPRVAVGFEPELEVFATERRKPGDGPGSVLSQLQTELGNTIVGRELETALPQDLYGTVLVLPARQVQEVCEALRSSSNRTVRLVSTSHAFLGLLQARKRAGKGLEIRVACGEAHGIALLTLRGNLVARHCFRFAAARHLAVVAAIRRLLGIAQETLGFEDAPGVALHVAADEQLSAAFFAAETGVEPVFAPVVTEDDAILCCALAHHAFVAKHRVELTRFDGTAEERAPVKAAAGMLVAIGAVGWWIHGKARPVEEEIERLLAEVAPVTQRLGEDRVELEDLADRLRVAAAAASAFVGDRARWAPILGDVAALVPEGTRLESFKGSYPLLFSDDGGSDGMLRGGQNDDSSLELKLVRPLDGDQDDSRVASDFADALAADPAVAAAFPEIEGVSVVRHERDATSPFVSIVVRARPR